MCRTRTRITDLHPDVLKHILKKVAKTPDGAANFARVMSISKEFNLLTKDEDVLKVVNFHRCVAHSDANDSFWVGNGLVARCARAGNMFARLFLYLHIRCLMDAAKVKMIEFTSARQSCVEMIEATERQVCTRSMKWGIISAIEDLKLLDDSIDQDLQKADELGRSLM